MANDSRGKESKPLKPPSVLNHIEDKLRQGQAYETISKSVEDRFGISVHWTTIWRYVQRGETEEPYSRFYEARNHAEKHEKTAV